MPQFRLVFVFAGAKHEILDGFTRVLAVVEDQLHLLRDGHFNVMSSGEAESGAGGEYAFSNFTAQALKDFREAATLT